MPWKVVSIVWPAIVAALLPLDLPNLVARLPSIIMTLDALHPRRSDRPDDRSRPRQLDDFRTRFVTHG